MPLTDHTAGIREVREPHRFDVARLQAYLRDKIPEAVHELNVHQFEGGQSNPTYLLETSGKRYVLRRKPPGTLLPSAHAVDREFRVISALQGTRVPVPKAICYCADDAVVGTPFYIMAYVEGRQFWSPDLPELDPRERLVPGFRVRLEGPTEFGTVQADAEAAAVERVHIRQRSASSSHFCLPIGHWDHSLAVVGDDRDAFRSAHRRFEPTSGIALMPGHFLQVMFARNVVEAVASTTMDEQRGYQQLVVDRGGCKIDDILIDRSQF